jgi:D-glycero-D-manno-heptose 1,7-bisphosphate phosphatase
MQRELFPAVFLDRDGTLMEEVNYCRDPALVRVFEGIPASLSRLKQAGFKLFLVTNQSGIGRGILNYSDFEAVQREFFRQVGTGLIDDVYFAPEAPEEPSERRKPAPGMLLEAANQHSIHLNASWTVGDKISDIEAGRAAGTRTVLVLTGYGAQHSSGCSADLIVKDFGAAADVILKTQANLV